MERIFRIFLMAMVGLLVPLSFVAEGLGVEAGFDESVIAISDVPQVQRVNIAKLMGRDFDEVRHYLIGDNIAYRHSPHEIITYHSPHGSGRSIQFNIGIGIITYDSCAEGPGWIGYFGIHFREQENIGFRPFSDDEDFLGFEASKRFRFNGLGHLSTRTDVETAFPTEYFHRAYVRDLAVLGIYHFTRCGERVRSGDIETGWPLEESWLVMRYDSVVYWNDDFLLIFDFAADGGVIAMLVFSNRAN